MTTKTVCQLDAHGYFVGLSDADASPLEPGVWLLPGGCVDAPAPQVPVGKRARWVGDGFDLENIPPEVPETPAPSIEELRAEAWEKIKLERDRRTQLGGYEVGGKWFHSDTFSRTQQVGLVLLGANIPPGTQWKTLDGSFVTMTQQLAMQIFQAAAASDIATFAAAEAHKAAMLASADPLAYDYLSSGWPVAFVA